MKNLIKYGMMKAFQKLKFGKKAQAGGPLGIFVAIAIGIISLAVTLVALFIFLAQAKALSMVSSDGNATAAVQKLQTASQTIPDLLQLAIFVLVMFALLGVIVFGGMYGYNKMKGR